MSVGDLRPARQRHFSTPWSASAPPSSSSSSTPGTFLYSRSLAHESTADVIPEFDQCQFDGARRRPDLGSKHLRPHRAPSSSSTSTASRVWRDPRQHQHQHQHQHHQHRPSEPPVAATAAPIREYRSQSALDGAYRPPRLAYFKAHHDTMPATVGRAGRERTYIGSQCATCEEPLEHTLRGERILQLTCGHVSHEACFYEYVKEFAAHTCPTCDAPLALDASRGGNVDFQNLTKFVESSKAPEPVQERIDSLRSGAWDSSTVRQSIEPHQPPVALRGHVLPDRTRPSYADPDSARSDLSASHARNGSSGTGYTSLYHPTVDSASANIRKHDYDVQSMEVAINAARPLSRCPIPPPTVTIRSEFPTINKSSQQQSLTCLVTVEVVEGKWHPPAASTTESSEMTVTESEPREPASPVASRDQQRSRAGTRRSRAPSSSNLSRPVDSVHEDSSALADMKADLYRRVDNWHGLDFDRFGRLTLHGMMRVAKDGHSWQVLECYLFEEMLICVKEKRNSVSARINGPSGPRGRCTLKGSILVKKHLKQIDTTPDTHTLRLSLSVAELPQFHLQFLERGQMETWRCALLDINRPEPEPLLEDHILSVTDEDDFPLRRQPPTRDSFAPSSSNGSRSHAATSHTEYTNGSQRDQLQAATPTASLNVPVDIVVVVPVSTSMQGLKIDLLRDALRFLVANLGERDRMGLVTFGSSSGGIPLVGMTNKSWNGWSKVIDSIRPLGQKNIRADAVEGANVAVDLLMQRRTRNPLSSVLLISDGASVEQESIDFVVSRAEAAKITINSFGLGLTHKPDTLVELATRTKASYTYVKDWMLLRECLAGALGSLQSSSHQNVKLRLCLPEGSPAKFVKVSGALQVTKRATGRETEVMLGDLRFGDKRDVLVQLAIPPAPSSHTSTPVDAWDNVIAGLEALGGANSDHEDTRPCSIEEIALIQADLSWGDLWREGTASQLPHPSLLTITVLPSSTKGSRPGTPPIPPHPSVVQRRMELLTSDMLSRSLTLVTRGQHDRGSHLLAETRSILRGLGKGGLPPLPPPTTALPPTPPCPPTPRSSDVLASPIPTNDSATNISLPDSHRTPTPPYNDAPSLASQASGSSTMTTIDQEMMKALNAELESGREWMAHPAVFGRDSRKAVLQAIGTINTQRAFTFRTPADALWASRIPGVKHLTDISRAWRASGQLALTEES